MYKVYVRIDENNLIKEINSSAFINDLENWTQIDEGEGDKYHHAQGNYFDKPILNEYGIPVYRLADGKAIERTAVEIQKDVDALPEPPPTLEDRLIEAEAKVIEMHTASELFAREYAKSENAKDEELLKISGLFPTYDYFVEKGEKIIAAETPVLTDGGILYRVAVDSMPDPVMRPAKVATNFVRINPPDKPNEFVPWERGSWDKGARVYWPHDETRRYWVSDIASNTRVPDEPDSNWTEIKRIRPTVQ